MKFRPYTNDANRLERRSDIDLTVNSRGTLNSAIHDGVQPNELLHNGTNHQLPGSPERSCPAIYRLLGNDLTLDERQHTQQCRACQIVLRAHKSSRHGTFDPTRLYRRARLLLLEWNPFLQFAVVALIVCCVAGGMMTFQSQPSSGSIGGSQPQSASKSIAAPPARTTEAQAPGLSRALSWPWSECKETPERINEWLGQGPKRAEIDRYANLLQEQMAGASAADRRSAALYWCSCVDSGSKKLAGLLAAETHHRAEKKPERVSKASPSRRKSG